MSSTAKAQEPTMEEILASIRRIIADDDPPSARHGRPSSVVALAPVQSPLYQSGVAPEKEELEDAELDALRPALDSDRSSSAARDRPLSLPASPEEDENVPEADEEAAPPSAAPVPSRNGSDPELREAQPAVARPFFPPRFPSGREPRSGGENGRKPEERLLSPATDSVLESAFGSLSSTVLSDAPRTLEEVVCEMLRPMLKNWLDENLPAIVERLVRQEIERVSRARR